MKSRLDPPGDSSAPFAPGSVSIRLYPHNELRPEEIVEELCAQASIALACGFDGVMTSEHHCGFAGYHPQPLQMATYVLEENETGWAAAAPLLLPLRATALVAEEVAWLNARHKGRVGLGVAMGSMDTDFEVAGTDRFEAGALFRTELPRLVSMLSGEDLGQLSADPALRACLGDPVPVLSAAVSVDAARRAADSGAGILMEGMSDADRIARLTRAFDDAGGRGSKVLIRRVWIGSASPGLVRSQRAVYESYSDTSSFGEDQTVQSDDPAAVASRLGEIVRTAQVDALNLRVHLPGMPPGLVREQIEALGESVVGSLRKALPSG